VRSQERAVEARSKSSILGTVEKRGRRTNEWGPVLVLPFFTNVQFSMKLISFDLDKHYSDRMVLEHCSLTFTKREGDSAKRFFGAARDAWNPEVGIH
jgi:hypothetical protein